MERLLRTADCHAQSCVRAHKLKPIAMTQMPSVFRDPFRHRPRGIFPRLLLLALLSNVLGAQNLPRFAFTASGSLTGEAITLDSQGNTYLTGVVSGNAFTASPGAYQTQNGGGTCYG